MTDNVTLHDLQAAMLGFLHHGDSAVETLVAEQPPLPVKARLSIYGSAYRIRLHQALETDHEMSAWYLGDEQFAEMAEAYIRKHPSTFKSLRDFGRALPDFLRREPPYDQLPVLAELAAFERLMLDVFDAPDAARAGVADLQAVPMDDWPDMHIRFHPSVHLHRTQTNAVSVWQALKASDTPPAPVVLERPSDWVLWRGIDRLSQFRSLSDIERSLLQSAVRGSDFAELCEELLPHLPESEISETVLSYLLGWLEQGLVRHFDG
jgi:hypothetical protein